MKPNEKNKYAVGTAALLVLGFLLWLSAHQRAALPQAMDRAQMPQIKTPDQLALKYAQKVTPRDAQALNNKPLPGLVELPILMYHHVGNFPATATPMRKDLTVSANDFEAQAKWLSENGYHTISLSDVYAYSLGKASLPQKPLIFTFDDGYSDVFINALPILKKYGFTGSFAVITQYPKSQAQDQQGDNFYASWEQIAQAKAAGMEIVCHTQNHFDGINPKYSAGYILQNLSGCRSDIKNRLGEALPILIYPYGHYSARYIGQAKKAGFLMGLTVHFGKYLNLEDLMHTPRVRVHGQETLETFIKILTG